MNILYTVPPALIALCPYCAPAAQRKRAPSHQSRRDIRAGMAADSFDLNNYRYIRTHTSQVRYGNNFPSMVIFDRDTPPGFGAMVTSMLFPRVDDYGRIVMFHQPVVRRHGRLISPNRIDDFYLDLCRRAGYEPHVTKTWFTTGRLARSAGPNWSCKVIQHPWHLSEQR